MKRLKSFIHNVNWLSSIVGGRLLAVRSLIQFKINKFSLIKGRCGQIEFYFRKSDLSGVNEILVEKEYEFLAPAIISKKDFSILDCGAHIGLPIIWALTINPELKVFSVEASPETFDVLNKNKDNTKSDWNIINRACWSNDDNINFSTRGDSMSHKATTNGEISVKGISLKDLMHNFPNGIDLMKVDIEGAEEEFICSAPDELRKVARIVIELHPQLCNAERVENTIRQFFPQIERINGRTSSKPLLYCTKN